MRRTPCRVFGLAALTASAVLTLAGCSPEPGPSPRAYYLLLEENQKRCEAILSEIYWAFHRGQFEGLRSETAWEAGQLEALEEPRSLAAGTLEVLAERFAELPESLEHHGLLEDMTATNRATCRLAIAPGGDKWAFETASSGLRHHWLVLFQNNRRALSKRDVDEDDRQELEDLRRDAEWRALAGS